MTNTILAGARLPPRVQRLWDLLAAPRTHVSLELVPTIVAGGLVRDGVIRSQERGRAVGMLKQFQFSFHQGEIDESSCTMSEPVCVPEMPVERTLDLRSPVLSFNGTWIDEGVAKLSLGDAIADASFIANTARLSVTMLHCPWGGIVEVYVDEKPVKVVDTFDPYESFAREWMMFDNVKPARHAVRIVATGRRAPDSNAAQVRLLGIGLSGPEMGPPAFERPIGSEANPLPARFLSLLADLGADALVLDCGGGRRHVDDPRYYNFEYDLSRYPDVLGDAHELPFQCDAFDLVLSQAVMEHMRNPFEASREIVRITRPGGLIYVESAFMQPAHCRPIHFFNTTIWGLMELFKETEILDQGHFGGLADLNRWISSYIARANQDPARVEAFVSLAKDLDECATHAERQFFSTGVYVLARKR